MSDLKRYIAYNEYGYDTISEEDDNGQWVRFEDAEDAIKAAVDRITALERRFSHYHVNNGANDECKECGFDLRDPLHFRARDKEPEHD